MHETIPDPADQAPLVARSVTPPSPSGRGGTTLLRQRAPRSCTVFVMTPPNEHTSEGGRDDRGVPYHAESALSSAQVLKVGAGQGPVRFFQNFSMTYGQAKKEYRCIVSTFAKEFLWRLVRPHGRGRRPAYDPAEPQSLQARSPSVGLFHPPERSLGGCGCTTSYGRPLRRGRSRD